MARKSRKKCATLQVKHESSFSAYATGIYVRLSVENSGKQDDGNSIENQISLCKEYAGGHPELRIEEIYQDNGEKGTNFDRPAFKRLMDDIKARRINCVLVKDLSRFGRDYIEVGEYLERIFPFLGVRFISVTDNYDSLTSSSAEGTLMVPLKNMMNDAYAKDISEKIITSFRARQERGEFLPAFPPYGYVKSKTKKYRYEIDTETAPFVKKIFEWKAEGVSHQEICNRLNEMGAVTPAKRKVELGIWHAEKYKHTVWYGRTLIDILKNPIYTGCIVYGRMPKSLYQGIKMHRADPKDWRIIRNAHEAIVSQELFDQVQEILNGNAKRMREKADRCAPARDQQPDLFRGIIFCGDCGKKMRFRRGNRDKDGTWKYHSRYNCAGYIDSGRTRCSIHTIRYQYVKDAVIEAVRLQMKTVEEKESFIKRVQSGAGRRVAEKRAAEVRYWTGKVEEVNRKRSGLYESFVEGILNEDEYKYAKERYDKEYLELIEKLDATKERKKKADDVFDGENDWLELIHQVRNIEEPDVGMIKSVIERIEIFEGSRVSIHFKCESQRKVFDEIVQEVLEETADCTGEGDSK